MDRNISDFTATFREVAVYTYKCRVCDTTYKNKGLWNYCPHCMSKQGRLIQNPVMKIDFIKA